MPVIRTYIATLKGVLISGIHNIFYAGYKNMPVIKTSYAVPDDILITDIHCIPLMFTKNSQMAHFLVGVKMSKAVN